MRLQPFLKWAGGKRWLVNHNDFLLPTFTGRYIEPFLGGGSVFFHTLPDAAILSDLNPKLINVYAAIRSSWSLVASKLAEMQRLHSRDFYYEERRRVHTNPHDQAAQFLYLNRTCWNGLYRENLSGEFNVPIGTKTQVLMPDDDFESASKALQNAEVVACDFQATMSRAKDGDLIFLDPPYTTAHNMNGFVKYNQKIFSWEDQKRLRKAVEIARDGGAKVVMTNADHETIWDLYSDLGEPTIVSRASVISGKSSFRGKTTEALFIFE